MSSNKTLAKNTLLLYIRMGVSMLVSLYTSRIVLSALGIEDFGIYGVVGGIVSMFGFLSNALSTSTSRYITTALGQDDKKKLQHYFSSSIYIHLILGLIIVLVAEIFGIYMINNNLVLPDNKLHAAQIILHFSILSSFISIIIVPFNALIIAHEKMEFYAYLTIVDTFIKLGIAWTIQIILYNRLEYYGFMLFLVAFLNLLSVFIYCRKSFNYLKIRLVYDSVVFKSIGSFTTWSLVGNLAWVGYTQGLNILLNIFFGPAVNAARSISVQVEGTIRNFTNNFQIAINPRILKSYAANEMQYMHKLVYASSRFSCYLMLFFSVPIFLETDKILQIWLVKVPEYTTSFIRIMLLIALMESMSNSIMTSVVATGKIKRYQLYIGILLLSIVPLSYIILKFGYSPVSVFFVYAIVEFLACVLRLIIVAPMIGLRKKDFVNHVVLNCFWVSMVGILIPLILHITINQGLIRLLIVCVSNVISTLLAIIFIGLRKNEQQYLLEYIKVKLHNLK